MLKNSKKSIFLYMEIVAQAFFITQKVDFLNILFLQIFGMLGCFRDQTQVTKTMIYSKLKSPKG